MGGQGPLPLPQAKGFTFKGMPPAQMQQQQQIPVQQIQMQQMQQNNGSNPYTVGAHANTKLRVFSKDVPGPLNPIIVCNRTGAPVQLFSDDKGGKPPPPGVPHPADMSPHDANCASRGKGPMPQMAPPSMPPPQPSMPPPSMPPPQVQVGSSLEERARALSERQEREAADWASKNSSANDVVDFPDAPTSSEEEQIQHTRRQTTATRTTPGRARVRSAVLDCRTELENLHNTFQPAGLENAAHVSMEDLDINMNANS